MPAYGSGKLQDTVDRLMAAGYDVKVEGSGVRVAGLGRMTISQAQGLLAKVAK